MLADPRDPRRRERPARPSSGLEGSPERPPAGLSPDDEDALWDTIVERGRPVGLVPRVTPVSTGPPQPVAPPIAAESAEVQAELEALRDSVAVLQAHVEALGVAAAAGSATTAELHAEVQALATLVASGRVRVNIDEGQVREIVVSVLRAVSTVEVNTPVPTDGRPILLKLRLKQREPSTEASHQHRP